MSGSFGTESNAFRKSKTTVATSFLLSIVLYQSQVVVSRVVVHHDIHVLKII